ncbi:MAG: PEF-CTERM sorting domain-containing protein [Candidatus Methanoperedens sp.]|nr:PEF-CTERM sorting domain-containing protein [Candidatus Methanoperedens sp.]
MNKSIVLLLYGFLTMIIFAGVVSAEPSVTIEPSSAHRGDTVTISGAGWMPGETLNIYDEEGNFFFEWVFDIHPVVKEDGTFSVITDVPKGFSQISIGIYDFSFSGSESEEQTWASLEVLPGIIWVVPSSGPPGTKIDIYGDLFSDSGGRTEDVSFDSRFLWGREGPDDGQGCQNLVDHIGFYINIGSSVGACRDNYYIPGDATPGWHKITVHDDGGVSADFYVTSPTYIPEYPTIALPIVALIGFVFILQRYQINR